MGNSADDEHIAPHGPRSKDAAHQAPLPKPECIFFPNKTLYTFQGRVQQSRIEGWLQLCSPQRLLRLVSPGIPWLSDET